MDRSPGVNWTEITQGAISFPYFHSAAIPPFLPIYLTRALGRKVLSPFSFLSLGLHLSQLQHQTQLAGFFVPREKKGKRGKRWAQAG